MRWLVKSNQPHSNLNTSLSPSGPCPTKQLWWPRCQSTPGLPWWLNSVEPSDFFSASPLWPFGLDSRSCYPFHGPNAMGESNTALVHSNHMLDFRFYTLHVMYKIQLWLFSCSATSCFLSFFALIHNIILSTLTQLRYLQFTVSFILNTILAVVRWNCRVSIRWV